MLPASPTAISIGLSTSAGIPRSPWVSGWGASSSTTCSTSGRPRSFPGSSSAGDAARLAAARLRMGWIGSRRVEALDLCRITVGDDPPPDLVRRRELDANVELAGQHDPPANLLHLGETAVDRLHALMDRLEQGGVPGQVAGIRPETVPAREDLEAGRIEREQGDDVRAPVTDHHRVGDQLAAQRVLDVGGGDVLASRRDDQVLLAIGDAEIPIPV